MRKVVFATTLNAIRNCRPCESGWKKLLAHLGKTKADAEPLNLLTILESNGTEDMLWALQAVGHPQVEKVARFMACDFAEAVLPIFEKKYPDDKRPANAIKVARRYANGKATDEERDAAAAAAWASERSAEWDAERAFALDAAGAAAGSAVRASERSAALDAAGAAAGSAVRAAALDAAETAAGEPERDAEFDAAVAAERSAQAKIIRKYLGRKS